MEHVVGKDLRLSLFEDQLQHGGENVLGGLVVVLIAVVVIVVVVALVVVMMTSASATAATAASTATATTATATTTSTTAAAASTAPTSRLIVRWHDATAACFLLRKLSSNWKKETRGLEQVSEFFYPKHHLMVYFMKSM
jgi:hypothetical protein